MALAPVPFRTALIDLKTLFLRQEWVRWLQSIKDAIDAAAQKIGAVSLTAQGAAIALTAISTPTLTAGLYRVDTYARITRAATVSSSLTVTVRWTDGGVAQSFTNTAITGNTTGTSQQRVFMVRADEGTTITYETAYASSGATSMQYGLDIRLEVMP